MGLLATDRRVLVLAFARMADSIGNSFLIVVLPLYVASGVVTGGTFGLGTALVTGLILSAFGFFNSVVQPFAGRLSDRTGKRRAFVIAGLLVLGVSNLAYAFVGTYATVMLVRIGQGIGVALTVPATIALVNDLSDSSTRGGSMGVFNSFRMLGFGGGPVLAGGVIYGGPYHVLGATVTGFEAAFYIASIGAFVSATLVTLLVRDPEPDPDIVDESNDGSGLTILAEQGDALFDPVFTLGVASLFMAIAIALLAPLESAVNAHLHQGPTLFGIEFGAFTLAQVFVQTPIGSLSDSHGRKPFVLAGLVLLVPATLAIGIVSTPTLMIAARFLQGVAGAMVFAPAFALAGDYARGSNSGTTLSVLTMAFGLGTAIGPIASGFLFGFGYAVPFVFGAAMAAMGAILVHTQIDEVGGNPAVRHVDGAPAAAD